MFFIALIVGLWSAFQLGGVTGFAAWHDFHYQGKPDPLDWDFLPEQGPLILPPMSKREFLLLFVPSLLSVLGGFFYALVAIFSSINLKVYSKPTYLTIGWDFAARAHHTWVMWKHLPLPSIEQNITLGVVWGIPFIFCLCFSLFWLFWTKRQSKEQAI